MSTIEMARQCGAAVDQILYGRSDYVAMTAFELERFEALIRADEREQIIALPQIKGNLFAEKAIRARKP